MADDMKRIAVHRDEMPRQMVKAVGKLGRPDLSPRAARRKRARQDHRAALRAARRQEEVTDGDASSDRDSG